MQKKSNKTKYNGIIYGMCNGVAMGTALGIVFDRTILGMAIGLGVGMFLTSPFLNKTDKKHDDDMKN